MIKNQIVIINKKWNKFINKKKLKYPNKSQNIKKMKVKIQLKKIQNCRKNLCSKKIIKICN